MLWNLILLAGLQAGSADTLAPSPDAAAAGTYLDAAARQMVRASREQRRASGAAITEYRTLARQRVSVGLRALRRDRILFRRELAARIHWVRDGVGEVEVLGARQVVPIALPDPAVPDANDLQSDPADLAFDPASDFLLRRIVGTGENSFIRHPLAAGSEADYRFASGDTTRLRLPDGRVVRLAELRVIPRRDDARLLRGSLWIDLDSYAPVRAVFRLARPFDLERDMPEEDVEDVPGLIKPIRGELRYITVEYGLWEGRWWLPRLIALDVVAEAGDLLRIPVVVEQWYEGYQVSAEPVQGPVAVEVAADTAGVVEQCSDGSCWHYRVVVPDDTASLLQSEYLPGSVYAQGESLIGGQELREIAGVVGASPGAAGWRWPQLRVDYLRPHLLRFNRVEGLALGARVEADFGAAVTDAELWMPTAALEPSAELGVSRHGFQAHQRVAVYRRLAAAVPAARPLGLGNSLSALLLGRDDGEYFRATGVELTGAPAAPGAMGYGWRFFAERQRSAPKRTDFSLAHLLGGEDFRDNIGAESADQMGADLSVSLTRGLNPVGWRWGARLQALAETGDYGFARPALASWLGFPLPGELVGAVEAAGGTSWGEVPVQSRWYLGGPASIRGFGGDARRSGTAFWRARAEVANQFPGARLVAFSDAGWIGPRDDARLEPSLLSVGVGASLVDGLLRLDLAHPLRGGDGWRLEAYLDAVL